MQLNKNIKIFLNYFFGPVLFAWLALSIYRQLTHQDHLEASWQHIRASFGSYRLVYLLLALLLVAVNWGIEAFKWKVSVRGISSVSFFTAFKAVLSGVSFSVTMPNRVGEYFGRMMYLPEGKRLKTISVTLVGSFAQLLVTMIAGIAGLLVLKKELLAHFPGWTAWFPLLLFVLTALSFLLLFFYFRAGASHRLFRRWVRAQKYAYLVEALAHFDRTLLIQVLLLSLARYLVFVVQYIFVFYLFDVAVPVEQVAAVMSVVFLAMAIVPSIALVEVGLRGEISIRLMGIFSANILGIGFTSVAVWLMNLVLPAIVGSLLLLNLRIFNKRNEGA